MRTRTRQHQHRPRVPRETKRLAVFQYLLSATVWMSMTIHECLSLHTCFPSRSLAQRKCRVPLSGWFVDRREYNGRSCVCVSMNVSERGDACMLSGEEVGIKNSRESSVSQTPCGDPYLWFLQNSDVYIYVYGIVNFNMFCECGITNAHRRRIREEDESLEHTQTHICVAS